MKSLPEVVRDFDRIANALGSTSASDVLTPAENALLALVPREAKRVIDVGCGDGRLARTLARRGSHVTAIDISPGMIRLARARTDARFAIDYRNANVMTDMDDRETFDVVVSVSVVHHLPLNVIVPRLKRLLVPGGTLLIQDVTQREGLRYFASNVAAALRSRSRRFFAAGISSRELAALYDEHGKAERYLAASAVEREYRELLPGGRVMNHIEWRYTVAWVARA
jgi:2-polyprenyl-3-methyl-5-hydroxy-6-metoxy-1,4-benzoquinol methylase